jgi:hypothetical protein
MSYGQKSPSFSYIITQGWDLRNRYSMNFSKRSPAGGGETISLFTAGGFCGKIEKIIRVF